MLLRRRRAATSAPLTADERAYVDRAVNADIDAYANELALHLGAAFDHVRDVLRADLEARAALLGEDAPYARDFYPAGSLPPMPETEDRALDAASWAALRRDLPARGVPTDVVEAVIDTFERNIVANRRDARRSRLGTWFAVAVSIIVVAIMFLPDPGAATHPDPDGAWAATVVGMLEPLASRVEGPVVVACADPARTDEGRVAISAELAAEVDDVALHEALGAADLPSDASGRFTHFMEDEGDPDAGQVVVIDRDPSGTLTAIRAYTRCGAV